MTDKPDDPKCIECRLVVIEVNSMRILTTAPAPGPLLPRELIPPYTRAAEALTGAIEERYGLRTIQLAILPGAEEISYCAVHEIMGLREEVYGLLSFVALDQIAPGELNETERATVLKIIKGEARELGRFARIGWIDELLAKTSKYRDQSSIPVIRQLNQGIDFCLLSLTYSTGRKMWFKAVGQPNTREYQLTLELQRRFPHYVPKLFTAVPAWNGWVSEDVIGSPLTRSNKKEDWENALSALAAMQLNLVGETECLYAAGAEDWSCSRLSSLLVPFFEEADRAMRAQNSTKVKPLGSEELCLLQNKLEVALSTMNEAGIPDTLLHGDIGHGNILLSPAGPVFLDWAETYVGHPFLSSEHLLADFGRCHPHLSRERHVLRQSYAQNWREYASAQTLTIVAALAPAIAAFAYAVIAWTSNASMSNAPRAWPLLRSMLRRTKQELEFARELAL
jgi:Phosphotransferase enzyme family